MKYWLIVFVSAALLASACASSGSDPDNADPDNARDVDTTNDTATPSLVWTPCAEQLTGGSPKECATLTVPLDHAEPDGETIDLAVARVVSRGDDRIGSLVFNPGGPGASGVEFLNQVALFTPPDVARRFDLVSFDPRGVGASDSIECDIEIDDNIRLLAEGDDAGWDDLIAESDAATDDCDANGLRLARYAGTNNAARDLDVLRAALGDAQLSYVGYSYGTRLGATYAELFPGNVRAMVLDAAVKPTNDLFEVGLGQASGFDRALENFAAACDADEDCILRDLGPTLDVISDLRSEIAEVGSFPTDDGDRVLEPGELDLAVVASLYSKASWPILAQALFVAEANQDGTLLQVLGDSFTGRQLDGTYNNLQVANGFINCADDPSRPDETTVRAQADETAAASVHFSDLLRADTGCLGVPESLDPLIIGAASDAPPILVIGNTGDPATPFEWSEELASSLDSAVLYSVEAEGHTAYGSVACVVETVNDYLVDLVLPDVGAGCSDNADADFFVPAGDSQIDVLVTVFDCLRDNGVDLPPIGTADILADPTGESFAELLDPTDPVVVEAIGACTDAILAAQGI